MNLAVLAPLAAVLALVVLAPGAAAIGPNPILDLVYENSQAIQSCLATSVSGSVGLTITADPPYLVLQSPELTPPSPECLVLPG